MGAIEDLAAALIGKQSQADIAASNPYYKFAAVPEQLGGLVIKGAGSGNYSNGDIFKSALITGLSQGLLGGIGDMYNDTLTERYQRAAKDASLGKIEDGDYGLSPSLFRKAKDAGSIFKLQNDFNDSQEKKKTLFTALSKAETPDQQQMIMEAAKASGLIDAKDYPSLASPSASTATEFEAPQTREGALADEIGRTAQLFQKKYGGTRGQSLEAATQLHKARRDEIDRQYKKVEEAQNQADSLNQIVATAQDALDKVGHTGFGGEAAQTLAGFAGLVSQDQQDKYTAGQMLESLKSKVVQMGAQGYKGAMDNREFQSILQSGPQLSKTPEANQQILNNWRYVAKVQQTYVDFMNQARESGVSVHDAEKTWREIKKEQPFMVKGEVNPFWLGEDDSPINKGLPETPLDNGMVTIRNKRTGETMQVPRYSLGG